MRLKLVLFPDEAQHRNLTIPNYLPLHPATVSRASSCQEVAWERPFNGMSEEYEQLDSKK